jgi:hypothetical protein
MTDVASTKTAILAALDPEHLHNLVAQMVDHLHGDANSVARAVETEPVRTREDQTGRRERHQGQALHDSGEVDHADLGPACRCGSPHGRGSLGARSAIASEIRRAPAIATAACSRQSLQQVIAHADRIGNRGERRVQRADADEETGVHDVEVVELVSLAVRVQYGALRVRSEAARPGLMGTPPPIKPEIMLPIIPRSRVGDDLPTPTPPSAPATRLIKICSSAEGSEPARKARSECYCRALWNLSADRAEN